MENWKTIEDFEDYEVSDLGRVRRCVQRSRNSLAGSLLKPQIRPCGHFHVSLWKSRKKHTKLLARLVATAFIPNPLNLPEVNHTGNKADNRASMLEWRTRQGNEDFARRNEQHGMGVRKDKRRLNTWYAYTKVRRKYMYIGTYRTKREALAARRAAVKALPEVL